MYITNTTDNVRGLIEELEQKKDLNKLRFLIYIFNLLNNNQINDINQLENLKNCQKLEKLILKGNPISNNPHYLEKINLILLRMRGYQRKRIWKMVIDIIVVKI